jgi:hypothetical protein
MKMKDTLMQYALMAQMAEVISGPYATSDGPIPYTGSTLTKKQKDYRYKRNKMQNESRRINRKH